MNDTSTKEATEALDMIIRGLVSERNACWPTVKPWTKKERDETILELARKARTLLTREGGLT
jgi:hypothetical protein